MRSSVSRDGESSKLRSCGPKFDLESVSEEREASMALSLSLWIYLQTGAYLRKVYHEVVGSSNGIKALLLDNTARR